MTRHPRNTGYILALLVLLVIGLLSECGTEYKRDSDLGPTMTAHAAVQLEATPPPPPRAGCKVGT